MDGWNQDKVETALEALVDARDVCYELENCERGGTTGCTTYAELGQYLQDLGERLIEAGRVTAAEEEDPEEEENNENSDDDEDSKSE